MKRLPRLLTAALLSALASVNVLAFMQARAMTSFTDHGGRTGRPEQLHVLDRISVIFTGVNVPRPRITRTPREINLSFETHRFANADRVAIEAWFIPNTTDSPLAILFHGYAASKSSLLGAARAFHGLGYATLLVDFYGSGGSSGSGTTIGVREADDVAAAAQYAKQMWPHRRLVLYGISMGGAAVLRAIAMHGINPDAVIVEATFDRLLNAGKNRFRSMGLPSTPLAELLLFWGGVQHGDNFFFHNPIEYAHSVHCPALVLHGERDERTTVDEARGIALAMGHKAQFIAYADVPHVPIVDARRSDWQRDVGAFLRQVQ